ncbi:MAG: hypothetical protein ACI4MP_05780 [Candidatus Ventricola sp.]
MSKRQLCRAGAALLLAVAFALVFYAFTTPLGPSIGSDNAIYMTMGTALARGYAPYTEIFDHKGPLLFILQAIPQIVSGGYSTLALFVQQVIFLFACLLLAGGVARELHAPAWLVQILYLALIGSMTGGGNLTEEYTNVFTFAGLLVVLRVFGQGLPRETKGLFARAGVLGAMAMLCFLTRANNALVLCAMTLTLAFCLLARRRFASLARCAGGFAVGMAAVALPVAAWLASRGALEASVYGSILHNLMYAQTDGVSRVQMLLHSGYGHAAVLMAALSCAGALALFRRSPALALSMVAGAAAAGLAAFVSHKYYDHYLILGAPLAAMGAAAVLGRLHPKSRRVRAVPAAAVLAVCLLWLGVKGAQTNAWRLSECEGLDAFTQDAQALYAQVPEDERDAFMAYRVEPKWYVAAEALPCMRFYFLQEVLADADPAVMEEIVETFENDPPKWLVIYYNREFGPPYDERVAEIFDTRYAFVDARGEYQLRKLREAL